jgi:hypothetical protein
MAAIIDNLASNKPDVKLLPFYLMDRYNSVDIYRVNSLYSLFTDEQYNPLAWVADYFDQFNVAYDPDYVRSDPTAPDDMFKAMFGQFYQFYYSYFIYTFYPIHKHMEQAMGLVMFMIQKWPLDPIMMFKAEIKNVAGFEPMCPDVQMAITDKLIKVSLLFPAWGAYIYHSITRVVMLLYITVFYYLMFIYNFFFTIFAAIRNFFLDFIILPLWGLYMMIFNFFLAIQMWFINLMWAIIFWPISIMELLIRFALVIQQLILSLIWAIVWPLINFMIWLVMFIPNLVFKFIITPLMLALAWVFSIILYIAFYIPNLLKYYVQLMYRLILQPLDNICIMFWGILDGILDGILAVVSPPEWEMAWPFLEPAGGIISMASN